MGSYGIFLTLCVFALDVIGTFQQTTTDTFSFDTPTDIIFALDGSNDIPAADFQRQVTILNNILNRLDIRPNQVHVGALLFWRSNIQVVDFQTDRSEIVKHSTTWRQGGFGVSTADALRRAKALFESHRGHTGSVRKVVVLITNEVSIDTATAIQEADRLRADGIHVLAHGYDYGTLDEAQLDKITAMQLNVRRSATLDEMEGHLASLLRRGSTLPAINIPTTGDCPNALVDLVIIMDSSGSVRSDRFDLMKRFVRDLLNDASIDNGNVRVGVVTYSSSEQVAFNLNTYNTKADVLDAVMDIQYVAGSTNTAAALKTMREVMFTATNGDRAGVDNVAILMTDGLSNVDQVTTIPEAEKSRIEGIHIYGIGITLTNTMELDAIVTLPVNENRFAVQTFDELNGLSQRVFTALCNDTVVTPQTQPPTVRPTQPPTEPPTQPPTVPPTQPPTDCPNARLDLVIILDSSTSVGAPNYELMKGFVRDFLNGVDIDSGNVRVGVVIYSSNDQVMFQLNEHNNKADVLSAVMNIPYVQGNTNTADGLRAMRDMFTTANGDRSGVDNVAILLTDGLSNINRQSTIPEAEHSRREKIHIYGIGIGLVDTSELDAIVSRPVNENRFAVKNFGELSGLRQQVFSTLCDETVINCKYGATDVYLVADVSAAAQQLGSQTNQNDFGLMKSSLTQFINTVQRRGANDITLRVGLISYSRTANLVVDPANPNSVANVAAAIPNIATGNALQDSNLLRGLARITNRPRLANHRSYVIVVTPGQFNAAQNRDALNAEVQRVKNLGYTVIVMYVNNNNNNLQLLKGIASSPRFFIPVNSYKDLATMLINFNAKFLCPGPQAVKMPGLCANSGYVNQGTTYVAHPNKCDVYVQCYYNSMNELDLSVIRHCPGGLFWNEAAKRCSLPKTAQCVADKCIAGCEPYGMKGNCRGYFECESGRSVPKCCPKDSKFVAGKGCVKDNTNSCQDNCEVPKYCKLPGCVRRPNWNHPGSFYFTFPGSPAWFGNPCQGKDFDALTCKCSVPRNHICMPDMKYDFTNDNMVQQIQNGNLQGISVRGGTYDDSGLTLGTRERIHVNNLSRRINEPLTLKFSYREAPASLNPNRGTIFMSSSDKCFERGYGMALVYISSNFIGVTLKTPDGKSENIELHTMGFMANEFKHVAVVYDRGYLTMSIKGTYHHVIDKIKVSKDYNFPCGFDFGSSDDYDGFMGTFKSISLASCTPAKLH